jgi:hypothetical protein
LLLFSIAEALHRTIEELEEQITPTEFQEWLAFFRLREEKRPPGGGGGGKGTPKAKMGSQRRAR